MTDKNNKITRLGDYQSTPYEIRTVFLDVALDPQETMIVARIVLRCRGGTKAGTPLILDGDELQFVAASLNGEKLGNNSCAAEPQKFELFNPPHDGDFELEITTRCAPKDNTKLMGLFQSNSVYCTQCEADGFRRISYFYDRPDVLATYTTRIEADKLSTPQLLGNGNLVEQGALPNGRHFALWHDPHPKPSYLFALVGGDLGFIEDQFETCSGRQVALRIYVEKDKEQRATYAMGALKRSMKWDEQVFGREYDLDVFNIVAVSDFNMGAMENKGLNIFSDKFVLANAKTATDTDYAKIEAIIAHEYFHNWTGNRITCRDWFQLCLKEGLTVYRDQQFSADMRSPVVVRIGEVKKLQALQFPEDGGPLAHPVRPEKYQEINNLYTTTVYEKGAELVRMIAAIVGQNGFRKGMDLYFQRHDGEAARIEDFLAAFEDANDVDLGQFALWYSQAGTPQLSVSATYHPSLKTCSLEIEQSLGATPGQPQKKLMMIPLRFGLIGKDGRDMEIGRVDGGRVVGDVIQLTRRNTKLTFHGITERPVISLLRNFSAPVAITFAERKSDTLFKARHDSDLFNRWQAVQDLTLQNLMVATRNAKAVRPTRYDQRILDTLCELANDTALEAGFRAQLLTLPSEMEIGRAIGRNIDPEAIYTARLGFMQALGSALGEQMFSLMESLQTPGIYSSSAEPAGKRALHNVLLAYAVTVSKKEAVAIARRQFEQAPNMTDQLSAMVTLCHHVGDSDIVENVLASFYKANRDDPLVIDKWLAIQASIPGDKTLHRVRNLTRHPAFSLSNPNRTHALIGTFASGNQTGFNRVDGAGYEYLADIILQLDRINPQVAARLITALRSWNCLESVRRSAAKQALQRISAARLSNDVRDIVDRILG